MKKQLQIQLESLREKLRYLDEVEGERIKQNLIDADVGDDFRENEAAKLAVAEREMWLLRKYYLKKEIFEIKKKLHGLVK